jgi:hypothetical protein
VEGREGRGAPSKSSTGSMQHRGRAALQRRVKHPKYDWASVPVDVFASTCERWAQLHDFKDRATPSLPIQRL